MCAYYICMNEKHTYYCKACKGQDCKIKETCERYIESLNESYQDSYIMEMYMYPDCPNYIKKRQKA